MVTIRDVAKRAKVSITSASYALNNTGTISESTRTRILEAARELNYHPNAFAKNLKKGVTHTIGVFITRFGGSFYEEILEGIHDAVLKTDYDLIVCPESRSLRRILTHRQVDGSIVFDSRISTESILRLASKQFPIVVMDRNVKHDYIFPILIDNQKGSQEAFNHFYEQGLRKIYFIAGALDSFDTIERMKAFTEVADRHNISIKIYQGNFTEESGYSVAGSIINLGVLPEAVFCANDQMAIGFIHCMKEHGLKAPDDIAVVGFDDILVTRYMQPTLSTIGASRFTWGAAAATQLIEFIDNGKLFTPNRIQTQFIPRESSSKKIMNRKLLINGN